MYKRLTESEKAKVIELHTEGKCWREISEATGVSNGTLSGLLKGKRGHSESVRLARSNGRYVLTENGRKSLSEVGKRACIRNGKYWTKPEQKFKELLNSIGIGVKFPEYLENELGLKSDIEGEVYFQYPVQRWICDFAEPERKIVYRIHGDYWHANPLLYNHSNLTRPQIVNVRQDKNCKTYLESKGWTVCDIWASEIDWNTELVKQKIWAGRKRVTPSALHAEVVGFESQSAHHLEDWSEKLKSIWFKKPRERIITKKKCQSCGELFIVYGKNARCLNRKFCSPTCASITKRICQRPSREQLESEIKSMSWLAIGRKYGVSDNAARKWARLYGLL